MRILILGGTGNISTAITRVLQTQGHDLTLFNNDATRPDWLRLEVKVLSGDRKNYAAFEQQFAGLGPWDCVVDMIAFEPEDAECDVRVFRGRTKQFIFCSTVDVYDKTPRRYPVTELVGHEHVAPGRKRDPGAGFDWAALGRQAGFPAAIKIAC